MKVIAVIPARGGSKRIPKKNIKLLAGHPLIAYTISAAKSAECFEQVYVSTEHPEIAHQAVIYGAKVIDRPYNYAQDDSPDSDWITHAFKYFDKEKIPIDVLAKVRTTNPLRNKEFFNTAINSFAEIYNDADSLRTVSKCAEHPARMWTSNGKYITPILDYIKNGIPGYGLPYDSLPTVFNQTGSLELIKQDNYEKFGNHSGRKILPHMTSETEAFDINSTIEWEFLKFLVRENPTLLPAVN